MHFSIPCFTFFFLWRWAKRPVDRAYEHLWRLKCVGCYRWDVMVYFFFPNGKPVFHYQNKRESYKQSLEVSSYYSSNVYRNEVMMVYVTQYSQILLSENIVLLHPQCLQKRKDLTMYVTQYSQILCMYKGEPHRTYCTKLSTSTLLKHVVKSKRKKNALKPTELSSRWSIYFCPFSTLFFRREFSSMCVYANCFYFLFFIFYQEFWRSL